jgi:hypothetical protein
MDYSFPTDLAGQVIERWNTFVSRHDRPAPPLPAAADLRHILETAFFASLTREEGRDLRFVLCCAPDLDVRRDGFDEPVAVVPFSSPRPVTVESLRALAPAVSPNNAAILIRWTRDGDSSHSEIAGVLNVGSNLARARSGRSFYHRPAPYALLIDVRDAGEMQIYRGGIRLASLKSGQLHDQLAFSGVEFLPISGILAAGEEALDPRFRVPDNEPRRETTDFQWTAHLNTVLCIVNSVRERGHGGTLLLVAPNAVTTLPIRLKFGVEDDGSVLRERFIDFINARHALADARWQRKSGGRTGPQEAALSLLQNATFVAEEDLADAADLVARLAGVDGAVVLQSDLRALGFGAEIVLDAARPVTAYEVIGNPRRSKDWPAVDSENFGMRHRSALRCVAVSESTAAFVVSQDGTVSFFWKQDGRVFLKRNVNTANPNMVGA